MKTSFITLLLFYFAFSQNNPNDFHYKKDKIYQLMELDSMPVFEGGYDSLLSYIDKCFVFPEIYADASIQGQVICKFVITEDGNIIDVKVLQGIDKSFRQAYRISFGQSFRPAFSVEAGRYIGNGC